VISPVSEDPFCFHFFNSDRRFTLSFSRLHHAFFVICSFLLWCLFIFPPFFFKAFIVLFRYQLAFLRRLSFFPPPHFKPRPGWSLPVLSPVFLFLLACFCQCDFVGGNASSSPFFLLLPPDVAGSPELPYLFFPCHGKMSLCVCPPTRGFSPA